jgi:chemotaxis family two-component system response regulator Rcp1
MKPLAVFLAEDNEGDVLLVRESFNAKNLPCELLVAEDGEIALRLIDGFGSDQPCPDIVLMDLNLPKVEGAELLQRIRANTNCSKIPVLVVSSSNSPKDLLMVAECGARYFRKPCELDEYMLLADVVMEMVGFGGGGVVQSATA